MASRSQTAIGSDEKILLLILGLIIGAMVILGLIFAVANGIAGGTAGFLHELGLPRDMALDLYKAIRWTVVGVALFGIGIIAAKVLSR